jgi:hypothetical protein
MAMINKRSGAFPTALVYVTVGTVIGSCTIVSLVFNAPQTQAGYLCAVAVLMTGLALLAMGLLSGRIGRPDGTAELALPELTAPAASVPLVVPLNHAVHGMAPTTPALGGYPLRWVNYQGAAAERRP